MSAAVTVKFIILIILLVLSAFFSSSETALTTVNLIKIRSLADEGDKRAEKVLKVTSNSSKMLSAILIGNNIVNLSASALTTSLAITLFGSGFVGAATGILTLLVLIFGEISPKTMATLRAERISLRFGGIILALATVLTPVIIVVNKLANIVLRLMGADPDEKKKPLTERELRTMMDVSHEEGVIEESEKKLLDNVFDFGDADAKDIMVPRVDMTMVQADTGYDELIEIFKEDHYTRLPVYDKDRDDIIGILNFKDLLLCSRDGFILRDNLRDAHFTYEHKKTAELLVELRRSDVNMAIVLDEYGQIAGMITMEDLIEEIVGEIYDEYDEEDEKAALCVSENEYIVDGSMSLNDLNEAFGLKLFSEEYDTISGYVMEKLDRLPAVRESVTTPDGVFLQVLAKSGHRIEKIFVRLPKTEDEDGKPR